MRYEVFAHFFAVCPCYRRLYQNLAYLNFHSTSLEACKASNTVQELLYRHFIAISGFRFLHVAI